MSRVFVLLIFVNIVAVAYFAVFVESNKNAKQFVAGSTILATLFCLFYAAAENLSTFQNMGPTFALFFNFLFVFGLMNLWESNKPQRWG